MTTWSPEKRAAGVAKALQSAGAEPGNPTSAPCTARTLRKEKFVEGILMGLDGKTAAIRAGYSARSAKQAGWHLLNEDPWVIEQLERRRQELAESHRLDLDQMIAQLQEDRTFAIETKNAAAAVRSSETLAKLLGHLVERRDHRVLGNFSIVIEGLGD